MARQHVLIVDADSSSRRLLEVSLKKAGYQVTPACDAEEASSLLEHADPDLILAETRLPGRDGFTFCRDVKHREDGVDIPFIFLTAATSLDDKIRGLELGADDYLVKPVYVKEITSRIGALLQRRDRQRLEREAAARTTFTGQLADIAVVDLLQTIQISGKSGVVTLRSDGASGALWFNDGKVIDAECGQLRGAMAVYRLLTWSSGTFDVEFTTVDRASKIPDTTQGLLMEGLRRLDEWGRLLEQLPPLTSRLHVVEERLHDRIEPLTANQRALIAQFDGERTLASVLDASGLDDLVALGSISTLYFEGLVASPDPLEDPVVMALGSADTSDVAWPVTETFAGARARRDPASEPEAESQREEPSRRDYTTWPELEGFELELDADAAVEPDTSSATTVVSNPAMGSSERLADPDAMSSPVALDQDVAQQEDGVAEPDAVTAVSDRPTTDPWTPGGAERSPESAHPYASSQAAASTDPTPSPDLADAATQSRLDERVAATSPTDAEILATDDVSWGERVAAPAGRQDAVAVPEEPVSDEPASASELEPRWHAAPSGEDSDPSYGDLEQPVLSPRFRPAERAWPAPAIGSPIAPVLPQGAPPVVDVPRFEPPQASPDEPRTHGFAPEQPVSNVVAAPGPSRHSTVASPASAAVYAAPSPAARTDRHVDGAHVQRLVAHEGVVAPEMGTSRARASGSLGELAGDATTNTSSRRRGPSPAESLVGLIAGGEEDFARLRQAAGNPERPASEVELVHTPLDEDVAGATEPRRHAKGQTRVAQVEFGPALEASDSAFDDELDEPQSRALVPTQRALMPLATTRHSAPLVEAGRNIGLTIVGAVSTLLVVALGHAMWGGSAATTATTNLTEPPVASSNAMAPRPVDPPATGLEPTTPVAAKPSANHEPAPATASTPRAAPTPTPTPTPTPHDLQDSAVAEASDAGAHEQIRRARDALRRRRFAEARELAQTVLTTDPNHAAAYLVVAKISLEQAELASALEAARRAATLDPNLSEAYLSLGVAHEARGEIEAAAEAYARFLELDPNNAYASTIRKQLDVLRGKLP